MQRASIEGVWWTGEEAVFLTDLPRRLPVNSNGKRIHVSGVYRWAKPGIRGVRMRTFLLGGRLATTLSEVDRFCNAVTERTRSECEPPDEDDLRDRGLL